MKKLQDYDAIIFDLDGTLLDTETLSSYCILQVLQEYQIHLPEISWSLKKKIIGLPGVDWARIVIDSIPENDRGDSYEELTPEILLLRWEYYMSLNADQVELMPGTIEILDELKALKSIHHQKLAIATSSRRVAGMKKLSMYPTMIEQMDLIVYGDDEEITAGKPAPDIFLLTGITTIFYNLLKFFVTSCYRLCLIAKRLGVSAEKCVVFEDSLNGIRAGKVAQMSVIAIPDSRVFEDPHDLQQYQELADACYPSFLTVVL